MSSPFSIRVARDDDHARFTRFFAELGVHDPVPGFERWKSAMAPTTFFVERDGRAVGYAWYEVFGRDGYVRHVVVDAEVRRAGVGRALMHELETRLRAAGCDRWRLNVKRDNAAAIGLYRAFGMDVEHPTTVVRVPWSSVATLPRAAYTIEAREAESREDRALEASFDLPSGRLASSRATSNVRVLRLVDHHDAANPKVGIACFDPAFPGCFPFKVARPEFAHTLLVALAPFAPPDKTWIQLVVEDDVPLAKLLLARGAELVFEILHFSGALPTDEALSP
ncbi:MAG: GNAT family N-acetyltransferase [Planctomycetes bacterium]|nr:GNAT family N-acetyltransferase [Planctomycetota bacterium]